jgi:hypothetical protein
MFIITKSGKRYSYAEFKRGFKKIPYLYIPTVKLIKLRKIKLTDEKMIKWIDEHLHLLNDQYFNHYNNSYKHIKIENIPRNQQFNETYFDKNIILEYGHPEVKEYHIDDFGYDLNNWTGNHINIFTDNKFLINYTNIVKPIEIGLLFSKCLIIADQLIKTIGPNDFSNYYSKARFKREIKDYFYIDNEGKRSKKERIYYKHPEFSLIVNYVLPEELFEPRLTMALFEYTHIREFATLFPGAWSILYKIKKGDQFEKFTRDIKPTIFKTDYRLILNKDHQAFERGQLYYKVISLVYQIRITKIMREIYSRLKKCEIVFIPLRDSVVVSSLYEEATTYIIETIFKKHIDDRLHWIVSKEKHF